MSAAGWIIVVVVVAAAVVAAGVFFAGRAAKRRQLQQRFGPEYDRVVAEEGDRRSGERRLSEAVKTRESLDLRDLTPAERDGFTTRWQGIQAEFVDQPSGAARHADELISEVMRARGYPAEDAGNRVDLLAADHPDVVAQYREAEQLRSANAGDTEALRGAVVRYRALFEQLVGVDEGAASPIAGLGADSADVRGDRAPGTAVPATDVPATDVPATDVPATDARADRTDDVGSDEDRRHPHGHEPTVRGEAAVPPAQDAPYPADEASSSDATEGEDARRPRGHEPTVRGDAAVPTARDRR